MANVDKPTTHSRPIPINTRRGRAHSVSESSSSESSSPSSPVSPLQSPLSGTQPRVVGPISPGASPILSYFLAQSPAGKPAPPAAATFPFRRAPGGFGASSAIVDGTWLSLLPAYEPPLNTHRSHDLLYFSDDSESDAPTPLPSPTAHARRASVAWAGGDRFAQQTPTQPPPAVPDQTDRAAGLLRRLSLGGSALRVSHSDCHRVSCTMTNDRGARPQPPVPQIKTQPAPAGARTPPGTPTAERVPRKTRRANTLAPGTARPKRAPSPMGERILTGHFDGFN
ncbi:hypothetical protein EIP86_006421 [Pleurotus ostreatoroseus]|nr:hypothetical protein EIP86_006421 [Pleurotus ostreatoroseus]